MTGGKVEKGRTENRGGRRKEAERGMVCGLCTPVRKSIENRRFAGTAPVWPQLSGTKGSPPPTILTVRKLDEWIFYAV